MVNFVPIVLSAVALQAYALPAFQVDKLPRAEGESSAPKETATTAPAVSTTKSDGPASSVTSAPHSSGSSSSAHASGSSSSGHASGSSVSAPASGSSSKPSSSSALGKSASSPSPSSSKSASPSPSGQPAEDSPIFDYIATGLSDWAKSKGVDPLSLYFVEGWQSVGAAGNDSLSDPDLNQLYFDASDTVPSKNETTDETVNSASQTFVSFVQQVNDIYSKSTEVNQTENDALTSAAKKSGKACTTDLEPVLDTAIKQYRLEAAIHNIVLILGNITGGGNTTGDAQDTNVSMTSWRDPDFISWAQGNSNYSTPINDCLNAQADYDKEYAAIYGNNLELFSATISNLKPFIIPGSVEVPGINMKVSGSGDSPVPDLSIAQGGSFLPKYSIPLLKGTLEAWLADANKTNSTDAEFTWNSEDPSHKLHRTARRANFGRDDKKPASPTSVSQAATAAVTPIAPIKKLTGIGPVLQPASVNGSVETFEMSFTNITIMKIEAGLWFDNHRAAAAIMSANSSDQYTSATKPVFDKFYGTSKAPGDAAITNTDVIVAFQPSYTYTYGSEDDAKKADGSENTTRDGNKIIYNDTSQNAYILAYVQANFWDNH